MTTDLTLKLLTNILDVTRMGIGLPNGVLVASNRNGEYTAWKRPFLGPTEEIVCATIPELAAAMEAMGWLK